MTRFDWPGLMRAGLRGAGLTPDDFWKLTPAELQTLLSGGSAARPMGRDRLAELAAAYPDHQASEDGEQ